MRWPAARPPTAARRRAWRGLAADDSRPNTSRFASTFGHTWSTQARTGAERRTASCVRSSQVSPAASILVRITCAMRCASSSRPAPYLTPRSRSSAASSAISCAGTRQRRDPRGRTRASAGGLIGRPERAAQHVGHPRVALDPAGLVAVGAARRNRGHQLGDGGLGDVEFAEGGQNVPDVGEEGEVRSDDDHAAPGHLLLVRVQQVGDAVQPDGRLPGARRALHAHGLAGVAAHDVVLVGLDGGDDVAHRPGSRPLDFRDEQLARLFFLGTCAAVSRAGRGREDLVFVGGELRPGEPEAPPQRDPHRVGLAGAVEGA